MSILLTRGSGVVPARAPMLEYRQFWRRFILTIARRLKQCCGDAWQAITEVSSFGSEDRMVRCAGFELARFRYEIRKEQPIGGQELLRILPNANEPRLN